ncbi:uncharacterized protein BDR25DRAFT_384605 [Lindgomyces ingoldianus]|uniref:Uncharacterized protein n=1 Tax=Lindgomyces ingoldianus TaxID=673940 RepID=A0ACB6R733_9PLEO|nr:uncharacterized protein BDR25DRAFT_384605 [Lindgomyces ingoldianus]KAF2475059.1 hypothetical protein BDR25DRAFT_384605 [Lindgomyces ingoldianus]
MTTEIFPREPSALSLPLASPPRPKRRDVSTTLNYYRDPGDGSLPTPVFVGGDTVINERPTIPTPVVVRDVSGEEDKYRLDSHGFEFVRHESKEKGFEDDDAIISLYYRECEQIYKSATGATSVHIFGHLVRRGPTHWHSLGTGNATKKGPLHRVHIDQSYHGAELILRKHLPDEEVKTRMKHRWQIINLWRPVSTIFKDPLGVAAAHSIPESDLVSAEVVYTKQPPPLNRNETWTILPSDKHEWFFKNEQGPEDVLLIKCFDSSEVEGMVRRAPHCAFKDPEREGEEWADRQSIEVRALVFYDE